MGIHHWRSCCAVVVRNGGGGQITGALGERRSERGDDWCILLTVREETRGQGNAIIGE